MFRKTKKEKSRWIRNKTENKTKDLEKRKKLSRIFFYFLCIVFVVAVFYVMIFSAFVQNDKIEINGTNELQKDIVVENVRSYLAEKEMGFLPKSSFFLLSQNKLEQEILKRFRKIRVASVKKTFPNQLRIEIEEYKALLIWCSGEKCFLIDEHGIAYENADFSSRQIQENRLIKIIEDDGKLLEIGMQVMDEKTVEYYADLRESFPRKTGLNLQDEMHVNSRLAEDVKATTEQGFDVLVNFAIPAERSAEIMQVFLQKQYKNQDLAQLAYVDLRVENKIFYKTK